MACLPCRRFSLRNCVAKIYNSMKENLESMEYCHYEPYIDLVRFIFVPPVEKYITVLLDHWMCRHETCQIIIRDLRSWVQCSVSLVNTLIIRPVPQLFIDSILINNRIEIIACKCTHLGLKQIVLSILCFLLHRFECWINRNNKAPRGAPRSCMNDHTKTLTKQSRKRKRPGDDVSPCLGNPGRDPLDILPSSACGRVGHPSSGGELCFRTTSRCNKLKLVVTEPSSGAGCRISHRKRRTDYISLPIHSIALTEKIFDNSEILSSTFCEVPDDLLECIESLCRYINDLRNRITTEPIKYFVLNCDIFNKYIRFKLQSNKKMCNICRKLALSHKCQKKRSFKQTTVSLSDTDECLKKIITEKRKKCNYRLPVKHRRFSSSSCNSQVITLSSKRHDDCQHENDLLFRGEPNNNRCNLDLCRPNKNQKAPIKICACKYKEENSSYIHSYNLKKMLQEFKNNIDIIKINSESPNVPISICTNKKFQDIGISTDEINESCSVKELIFKNIETTVEDSNGSFDITNVYINDISFCYCETEEGTCNISRSINSIKKERGINTEELHNEKICLNSLINIGTNTEHKKSQENITQEFLENIRNLQQNRSMSCMCMNDSCTCGKFSSRVNFNQNILEKNPVTKRCYENTNKDFNELSHSEFINQIQCNVNEIASISKKIREKCLCKEQNKNNSNLTPKPLIKQISSEDCKIKLDISLPRTSLRSNENGIHINQFVPAKYLSDIEGRKMVANFAKTCIDSSCECKKISKNNSRLKKYFFTQINSPVKNSTSQTIQNMYRNQYFQIEGSISCCCVHSKLLYYAKYCIGDKNVYYRKRKGTKNLMKKFNFLHFFNDQLIKQIYKYIKKRIRCAFRKFKGRKLKNYNKSLSKYSYCSKCYKPKCSKCKLQNKYNSLNIMNKRKSCNLNSNYKVNKRTRLSGGTDFIYRNKRKLITESDSEFSTDISTSLLHYTDTACFNLNYCRNFKNVNNGLRRKCSNVQNSFFTINSSIGRRLVNDFSKNYLRRKRIKDFTSKWTYPYGTAKYNYYYFE